MLYSQSFIDAGVMAAVRGRHSCLPGLSFVPVDQLRTAAIQILFSVRDGIEAEDAMVHVSQLLEGIYDIAQQACEHIHGSPKKAWWMPCSMASTTKPCDAKA